ncbi:MAG: cellulase family glycosylhydrolase [Bacteroidota bacterium]|jgi:hypothetical protein|nr:cellulase family glycosylhydrolase [Bacteroidota bacterium]
MAEGYTRREFLRQGGMMAAVAGAAGTFTTGAGLPLVQDAIRQTVPRGGRPRVLLFHDPTFPTVDGVGIPAAGLAQGLQAAQVRTVDAAGLAAALNDGGFDLLVTAHASAFPEDAGMAVLGCLARGCAWLQLGGVPLAVPVRRGPAGWEVAPRRTRWHRKLCITQGVAVDCRDLARWEASPCCTELAEAAADVHADSAFAFTWRLTSTKYFPHEDGSAGTRDARVLPLLHGVAPDGVPMVAVAVQVDWLHGDYAGGRWVFYTGNDAPGEELIAQLAALAGNGATELAVTPEFARYRPAESATLHVRLHRPRSAGEAECIIDVLDQGRTVVTERRTLRWSSAAPLAQLTLPLGVLPALDTARFIDVHVRTTFTGAAGLGTVETRSGFWLADDAALASGSAVTRRGNELLKAGLPFTAAGTTYMAGDVQRNFLLEPNPWIWRTDFRAMRKAGITLLRTGIWYGWKRMMLEPGQVDEAALRAMDAFLLTAIEQDIPVIFSFFAFLPEAWGGENPYLDPRAVAAQRLFVAAFAQRYRSTPGLVWDLINEPSFSSPSQLWRCRPNYDRHEIAAWRNWLRALLPGMDDPARLRVLTDRWRGDTDESAALPRLEDFDDSHLFSDRQPLKARDYRLFAQDAFADWVRALADTIRAVDRPDRMIMVGQDEGGALDRPNPQFFADVVDITSVHSWWFNDDLLWDSVVTRAPGRPHLVQETGAMFYEAFDGTPWRSEAETARLIERKLAIAIGAGSAGFVQWLWNSNPYMPSDNEAGIGALRADGSAKPELAVLRAMSRFLAVIGPSLVAREEENVVLVLPQADQFSVRGNGIRATRTAVRAMASRCRVPLRAVGEYALRRDHARAALYVLPSPSVLTENAWQLLLAYAHAGSVVLVTGLLDRDENGQQIPRSARFGLDSVVRPVAAHEIVRLGKSSHTVVFRGDDLQRVERAMPLVKQDEDIFIVRHGAGRVIWCPVPVEMAEDPGASEAVYRLALHEADIEAPVRLRPDLPGVLSLVSRYRDGVLLTIVSEISEEVRVRVSLRTPDCDVDLALPAGRAVLLFIDRAGTVLHRSDRDDHGGHG